MEVYCLNVDYRGMRPSDNWENHTLFASVEGARKQFREERKSALMTLYCREDDIEKDDDDHFFAYNDDNESFEITIYRERVYE